MLINAYLDMTRLEDGTMPVHAGSVNLETLIGGVVDDLTAAARMGGQKLTCIAPQALTTRADPELLRRTLVNILGAAAPS